MKILLGLSMAFIVLAVPCFAHPSERPFYGQPQATVGGEQEGLEWFKEEFPEKYEQLMELREKNPQKFRMQAMRLKKGWRMFHRLREEDPEAYEMFKEMFKLQEQVRDLAESYKKEDSEKEKQEIRQKMENLLSEAFDMKLKLGERRLQKLEERLSKLADFLQKRKEHKEKIIQQHLAELIGGE